ncbi:MAG: PEP-CTERM system histidine kinase PrsK [Gammaproteobacteria bacterium]|nr:PEP-CTERM system histidine kinase PrsK [Gammaproteobacteria bacterium]
MAASLGALSFGALTVFLFVGILRHDDSRAVLFASAITFIWMLLLTLSRGSLVTALAGLAMYAAWLLALLRIIGGPLTNLEWAQLPSGARWILIGTAIALVTRGALTLNHGPLPIDPDGYAVIVSNQYLLLAHLLLTILALAVLDQLRGNVNTDHRWRTKFLVLGLFVIFGFDLILYTDALLFTGVDPTLAAVQPAIHALAAPLIAIAVRRHRSAALGISVSRQLAFQSTALVVAGGYLLLMAAAGYYMRTFGGQWGEVLQAFLLGAGVLALVIVGLSRDARNLLRRTVASHLFEQRYDYREEWQRLTRALAGGDPDESMEVRALRILSDLLNATGGAIWVSQRDGSFVQIVRRGVKWSEPLHAAACRPLREHFEDGGALVDLRRRHTEAGSYPKLTAPNALPTWPEARFLLPLMLDERLWGLVVLREPKVHTQLDWEDLALLELVARQTAGFLAQRQDSEALAESRQLDAFNQMNAFVIHDVKTVVSQLGLLVRNADRHRNNPAFLDDVISTTRHAVERMEKLLQQLRERRSDDTLVPTDVGQVCREAIERLARAQPRPALKIEPGPMILNAPPQQLLEVICHLLQNAVDATPDTGQVTLRARPGSPWHRIVIEDTGSGMSRAFIEKKLFAPFESTKGLTAMGIGVYQARQLIRSLGGDILVHSTEGVGTQMEILLPGEPTQEVTTDAASAHAASTASPTLTTS